MRRITKIWKSVSDPIRFNCAHAYFFLRRRGKRLKKASNTPFFSVIVASYNYANIIQETLESLLSQTYGRYEVIVVDDGSSDNSVEVIRRYCESDGRVMLYTHPENANCGLCATLQLGLSKAKGDFVAFCESDDKWDKCHLEMITDFINSYKKVVFVHNRIETFGAENPQITRNIRLFQEGLFHTGYNKIDNHRHPTLNKIGTFSSVVIKTDVLRSLDFNSPIPSHLDLWLYRQVFARYPMHYCPKAITYWRIHSDSYCSMDIEAHQGDLDKALEMLIEQSDELINEKV